MIDTFRSDGIRHILDDFLQSMLSFILRRKTDGRAFATGERHEVLDTELAK